MLHNECVACYKETNHKIECMDKYINKIVAVVKTFVNDIISNKVDNSIIKAHRISDAALDVARSDSHPSRRNMQGRIFQHVMRNIGYYERLAEQKGLDELLAHIDCALKQPEGFNNIEEMYVPSFVFGVKDALCKIQSLSECNTPSCTNEQVPHDALYSKVERGFSIAYQRDWRCNNNDQINVDDSEITIDGTAFIVPNNGSHLSKLQRNFTSPDEVEICIDKLVSPNIKSSDKNYMRYITRVPQRSDIVRHIGWSIRDIDGVDTQCIVVKLEDNLLTAFLYESNGSKYLVVDAKEPLTVEAMTEMVFSFLVALGIVVCDVYLDECWLFAYDDSSHIQLKGIEFQSLSPSIHCDYQIITTNVFSVLVPAAMKIDPEHGESRACDLITKLGLSNSLPCLGFEVFSRLVFNFCKHEALRRGLFLVLSGSKYTLEVQPGSYSIALEAISSLTKSIMGDSQDCLVDATLWEDELKPRFVSLVEEIEKEGIVTPVEKENLLKKVNSMNHGFNSDKLRALLVYFNYPLDKFDDITLDARNTMLHGSVHPKHMNKSELEANLFHLSINLHKLCCSIALLMAGYEGYIINNRKYYGFDKTCKSFIRIPKK